MRNGRGTFDGRFGRGESRWPSRPVPVAKMATLKMATFMEEATRGLGRFVPSWGPAISEPLHRRRNRRHQRSKGIAL